MRPIELTVQGLHSFREKQTVDFQALTAGGVFGIFGPTGSGKSSLLDAMTLALYGKVERAANNTQGILNHAEDTLAVTFTFELGYAGSKRRYKVERTLKRTGDVTLRTAMCRFLDVTEDPIVLADRMGDVNRQIEDFLGLSSDDFTRAVVLPQGKFAEFLHLKGSERRHMLERLFHLEKYGDELNRKLKERIADTTHAKNAVESELTGLGDASREAVLEAEKRLKQLESALHRANEELREIEKRYDEEKQLKEWQADKEQAEKQLTELQQKKADIDRMADALRESRLAERLLPYAEEKEASRVNLRQWQKEARASEKERQALSRKELEAREAYERARRLKSERGPELQVRLERLKLAKDDFEKLNKEKETLKKLSEAQKNTAAKLRDHERKLTKAKKDLQTYEQAQKDLKEKLEKLEVPIQKKNDIYYAYEAKQHIKHEQQRLAEERKEFERQQSAYSAGLQDLNEVQHQAALVLDQVTQRFAQVYRLYERSIEEERELNHFLARLEQRIGDWRQKLEQEKENALAHTLARRLEKGVPCPVCGSTEHPDPVQAQEPTETEQRLNGWEELKERVQDTLRELEHRKWRLHQMADRLTEALGLEDEAAAASEWQPTPAQRFPFFDVPNWEEQARHVLHLIIKEAEEITDLERMVRQEIQTLNQVRHQVQKTEEALKTLAADVNHRREKVNVLSEEIAQSQNAWKDRFAHLVYDQIEEEQHQIRRMDEQAALLRQRIEKSIPHIENKANEVSRITENMNELNVELSAITTEMKQREQIIAELYQAVNAVTEGQDVDVLLKQTQAVLNDLHQREEETQKVLNEAVTALKKAENRQVVAEQALRDAEQRDQQALNNWNKYTEDTSFHDTNEVKQALLDKKTEEAYVQTIESYEDQRKLLQQRIEERKAQLAGRSLSAEQWQATVSQLQQAAEKINHMREERGGAVRVLQDLRAKHERYLALSKKKEHLEDLLGQYQELERVLRGKAFVEFVAEEQLIQVSRNASDRLHTLTRGRYALEVDSNGGFVIRDDANGGVKRPVSSLSGGETFLTSLALALSLSASIQLKGEHPLEFFFLDEGFGTLDQELLETVITALEKLRTDHLCVGVISHVPELKERFPRKLLVTPAEPGGKGSTVHLESL